MTHKELSQIYYLRKEAQIVNNRLEELQAQATKITPTLSDAGAGKGGTVGARFENNTDERIELEHKIIELKEKIEIETLRIQDYIYNIDDSLMRMIITLRCINCYSWVKVAMIIGGNNTSDSVRKTYTRYMLNH